SGRHLAHAGSDGDQQADELLDSSRHELARVQDLFHADGRHALLVIFQAMDAAGKDGTIKHVMSGVNPQGCDVVSFKQPSVEELSHDWLWRFAKAAPGRGRIGIFNRSYYEEVLIVRVHPELLEAEGLTGSGGTWGERFDDIVGFERHLHRSRTTVVKFFLHISREEQRRRLLARIDDPKKNWKFSSGDLAERARWDDYSAAYEDALTSTSTHFAPWYVIPADHKPTMRALVAGVLVHSIEGLDLAYPHLGEAEHADLEKARASLLAEGT
ncbi:MAG TPA: PPK2 family polyphosphate kinase, partial [Acidimicrobiales bacterium]|nr:PPK2 family polyphosphate kinase [Acidimicrobiales bacterium]